jgi:hypothetical protein
MIWFAIAAGMCLSSAVLHLALGIARPAQTTHIVFAAAMAIIFPFQLVSAKFHGSASIEESIFYARLGVALAIAFMVVFTVFIRRYVSIDVPSWLTTAYLAASAAWLAYDLVAPHGLLFAAGPPSAFTRVPLGPLPVAWHAFNTLNVVWCVAAGWRAARHGRRSAIVISLGAMAFLVTVFVDLLRDVLGREWPFVGGFGVMFMTTVMSVELALDFRDNQRLLAKLLGDAMRVRDQLNTPLQIVRFDLELAAARGQLDPTALSRMQRAVDRLMRLGRSLRSASIEPLP